MPWRDRNGDVSPLKLIVLLLLLLPALALGWDWWQQALGPRPMEGLLRETGRDAIRLLWVSLLITPARQILRLPQLVEVRRMLGVAALGYALAHLVFYAADQRWDAWKIGSEIALRFYLTVGFVTLVGMLALGATSTDAALHRMGGAAWRRLHRLAYPIGLLAALHFWLHAKVDVTEPLLMAGLLAWLLGYRLIAPRGAAPGWLALLGLALTVTTLAVAAEFAWYRFATGIDPWRVLAANLDVAFGPRPAVWVLLATSLAAACRAARRERPRSRRTPRRRGAAEARPAEG